MHIGAGTENRTRDSLVQSEGWYATLTCFPKPSWALMDGNTLATLKVYDISDLSKYFDNAHARTTH